MHASSGALSGQPTRGVVRFSNLDMFYLSSCMHAFNAQKKPVFGHGQEGQLVALMATSSFGIRKSGLTASLDRGIVCTCWTFL